MHTTLKSHLRTDKSSEPKQDQSYVTAFYIQGIIAVISEWLKNDCSRQRSTDSIPHIVNIIQLCVKRHLHEA